MADKYNNTYGWDDDDPFKKGDIDKLNPDDATGANNLASYDTSVSKGVTEDPPYIPETYGATQTSSVESEPEQLSVFKPHVIADQKPVTELPDIQGYLSSAQQALGAVDDIVSKGYLENLHKMNVLAPEELDEDNVTLFKVDLMAYDKDEYATDKFVSAFTAMTFTSN